VSPTDPVVVAALFRAVGSHHNHFCLVALHQAVAGRPLILKAKLK